MQKKDPEYAKLAQNMIDLLEEVYQIYKKKVASGDK